jgi:hypothetical protein
VKAQVRRSQGVETGGVRTTEVTLGVDASNGNGSLVASTTPPLRATHRTEESASSGPAPSQVQLVLPLVPLRVVEATAENAPEPACGVQSRSRSMRSSAEPSGSR